MHGERDVVARKARVDAGGLEGCRDRAASERSGRAAVSHTDHVLADDGCGIWEAGRGPARRAAIVLHVIVRDRDLLAADERNRLGELGFRDVVLIGRDRNGGQDADDRDHDHEFDQGEPLLTVHGFLPLKNKC